MADIVRTLDVWQPPDVTTALAESGWNFQIARSVYTNTSQKEIFNVVWQSKKIAPLSNISWKRNHGLNWTANVPHDGATITVGGKWQAFKQGESETFDLNKEGHFVPSSQGFSGRYVVVDKVQYKHPDVLGIHILVGIQTDSGNFETIFVDPVARPLNSARVAYIPRDEVKWWYEAGMRTATMISNDVTQVGTANLSTPNEYGKHYYSTSFSTDTGSWSVSSDPPPRFLSDSRKSLATADIVRTIDVRQPQDVTTALAENGWHFQIAKSVITSTNPGKAIFNVVWKSKKIAPLSSISWKSNYGLNWTANVPHDGATVTEGGKWQACEPGQVFDLNKEGYFVPSTEAADPTFMKVGKVQYKYPDVPGIHILVGIQTHSGNFETIFVDPVALPPNSTAAYKPSDEVKWWYAAGVRTTTMFTNDVRHVKTLDFSRPNEHGKYYYSTSFSYDTGTWSTSSAPPPQ